MNMQTMPCPKCGADSPFRLRPDTQHYGEIRCPVHGHAWIPKPSEQKTARRKVGKEFFEFAPEDMRDAGKSGGKAGWQDQYVGGTYKPIERTGYDDAGGSAARVFYTAKASRADRGHGNNHPTVKPLDLMAYLCRLVTPPGGIVLDPFMGSGTTIKAALSEGFNAIGIEREPAYFAMAEHRMNGAQLGLGLDA